MLKLNKDCGDVAFALSLARAARAAMRELKNPAPVVFEEALFFLESEDFTGLCDTSELIERAARVSGRSDAVARWALLFNGNLEALLFGFAGFRSGARYA